MSLWFQWELHIAGSLCDDGADFKAVKAINAFKAAHGTINWNYKQLKY